MEPRDEGEAQAPRSRAPHITKRALKDKSLSVSFDEKDLRDYVGGFHKRKKKRRKEAEHQIQDKVRRKRIELRRKRKLDRDYVQNGVAEPATDSLTEELNDNDEQDEEDEPSPSLSGTATYDSGNMKVTVTTSEISPDEDQNLTEKTHTTAFPRKNEVVAEKKQKIPVIKKKPFKRVSKHKSQTKPKKREKKKMGSKNKRAR